MRFYASNSKHHLKTLILNSVVIIVVMCTIFLNSGKLFFIYKTILWGKRIIILIVWYLFCCCKKSKTRIVQGAARYAGCAGHFLQWALWSRCAACTQAVFPLLQSPFIPTARTGFWEVRVGDVYSEGARRSRRRCLLLRLLQWGHCSLCQTGQFWNII